MTSEPSEFTSREDRPTLAAGMALTAVSIGYAMIMSFPSLQLVGFLWLSIGLMICVIAIARPWSFQIEHGIGRKLILLLVISIIFETIVILSSAAEFRNTLSPDYLNDFLICIVFIGFLAVIQARDMRGLRIPLAMLLIAAFAILVGCELILRRNPGIDVYIFQQGGSDALLHGINPYDAAKIQFPNVYDRNTPFYGPGVIDATNHLTYGFPYPPLSLLMVIPAHVIAHDVRFANLFAIVASAVLMVLARPGRIGIFAAAIMLLTVRIFDVLFFDWTEPLLLLNFSVVMFCACRLPKALPWVLGLYFATKQYTVLTLPAVWLLIDSPTPWRELLRVYLKAGAVVLVTILPFLLWNPGQFIRAVALWQLVQPFRHDALSYLVLIYPQNLHKLPPMWIPFAVVIPAAALAIWRLPRTPAGFAAAVTLINLVFFAFNKQAFCNYYFFVVATACWSVAAYKSGYDVSQRNAGYGFPVLSAKG